MRPVGALTPLKREEIKELLAQVRSNEALTEQAFVEKCLRDFMGGWVPMEEYLKLFPTESANKIYKRVQQGSWKMQVHYASPKGSPAWVNLNAIRLWLDGSLEEDARARAEQQKSAP